LKNLVINYIFFRSSFLSKNVWWSKLSKKCLVIKNICFWWSEILWPIFFLFFLDVIQREISMIIFFVKYRNSHYLKQSWCKYEKIRIYFLFLSDWIYIQVLILFLYYSIILNKIHSFILKQHPFIYSSTRSIGIFFNKKFFWKRIIEKIFHGMFKDFIFN
jgi:hypothetical protein